MEENNSLQILDVEVENNSKQILDTEVENNENGSSLKDNNEEDTRDDIQEDSDQEFKSLLEATLERLRKLPVPQTEMKLPEPDTSIIGTYRKLCKALNIFESSTFLSSAESNTMDFSYECIRLSGAIAVTKALTASTSVEKLKLPFNKLGAQSLPAFTLLVDNNEYITHLNLSNNEIGKNSAKQLSDLVSACYFVEFLDLSGNDIGDKGAVEIGVALTKNDCIKKLNLSSNDIGESAGPELGTSLGKCSKMERLNLSRNHISEGASGLFNGLRKSELQYLNLSRNGIPDEAMTALDGFLRVCKSIQELDLTSNCITKKGILAFTVGLKRNTSLEKFHVAQNPFDGSAANNLLSSVGTSLKYLNLKGVKVNIPFLKTLHNHRKAGKDIEVVYGPDITYNCLPREYNVPEDSTIDDSNALEVAQKIADEKGLSLKNIMRSIAASAISQQAEEASNKQEEEDEKEKTEEEKKKEQMLLMTTDQFTRTLAGLMSIPKQTAQDLATAWSSEEGKVDLWSLIRKIKWRPDDLLIRIKNSEEGAPKEKTKGKDKKKK